MKNKILGYIVESDSRCGMMAAVNADESNRGEDATLWFGTSVTLFPSRESALRIIQRTIKFAKENGYDWPWINKAIIRPVRERK